MNFSKKLSAELSEHDKIMNSTALPNTATLLSGAFLCDGSRLGLEIVGVITAAVTIPTGKKMTVELQTSDAKNGTFATVATLSVSEAGALSAGKELFRFAPVSNMDSWKRIRIVSDTDLSAGKLNVFLVHAAA